MTRHDIDELRVRMLNHQVRDRVAVVEITARELDELLSVAAAYLMLLGLEETP